METRKPPVRDVLDATTCSFAPASTSALPVTVLPVASPAAAYHEDDASIETAVKNILCDASSLIPAREDRPVTTRNVATPGNVAKKTLPENLPNFVGGYIFGEPHTQKCSRARKCSRD